MGVLTKEGANVVCLVINVNLPYAACVNLQTYYAYICNKIDLPVNKGVFTRSRTNTKTIFLKVLVHGKDQNFAFAFDFLQCEHTLMKRH